MPHLIIEYSDQPVIEQHIEQIIDEVFIGAVGSGLFAEDDIKVRAIAYQFFKVGHSNKNFIHICAKILSGRSLEQRNTLSQSILKQVERLALNNLSCSVEVVEIDKDSYNKIIS